MSITAFAAPQYGAQATIEAARPSLSDEEREKLQEIHELINLMIRELPVMTQATARSYVMPPQAQYAYAPFQAPWGVSPYLPPRGF